MKRTQHAQQITDRFRDLVESSGDSLPAEHYKELTLLIEAGIDTVLLDTLEKIADKLGDFSQEVRHNAEAFD